MKKLLLASFALATLGANAQTKKVILEDYTGDWCQYCPNGTQGIKDLEVTYPTNFLPVATHVSNNDPLEIADGVTIKQAMNPSGGVPSGAIDRTQHSGSQVSMGINGTATQWKNVMATQVTKPAIASISFTGTKLQADGTYEADIRVKFTAAPTAGVPLNLSVYILENGIPAEVSNNLAQTNSTTHWGGANPLTTSQHGYKHDHTLRMSLGGAWGYSGVFPATPVIGTEYVKHITFKFPATANPAPWVASNVELYAFVTYNGPTNLGTDKAIINAEKMRLKDGFFKVGIEEAPKTSSIINTYPNPAKVTDIVSTVYTLTENSPVSMRVLNMVGQVVAIPMNNSNEVVGTHTHQWRPSENNLPAGNYILQLSVAGTTHTQKIVVE